MKILFTVCARAGSKSAVGKNIREFCGKPIVHYTLEIYEKYVEKYRNFGYEVDLAVNTDSKRLVEQIDQKETEYIFIERKAALADDVVAKGDVIRDTLLETEKITKVTYDLVVDLDLTSPLRNLADLEGTIRQVTQHERCNFAYSVVESRRNPYFNMVRRNEEGFYDRVIPSDFTARQQTPECFDMNASIYVYERAYLIDMRAEKRQALIWKMEDSLVLDIDSDSDFEMMEMLAGYYWEKGSYLDVRSCKD